jgi:uracil-DNA glycosylase
MKDVLLEEVKVTEALQAYHESSVVSCTRCASNPALAPWICLRQPAPYQPRPESPVLIVGHSPSVRSPKEIRTVLDLDRHDWLYRYLVGEILAPLGLELEQCAATNVVKCFTRKLPEDLESEGVSVMETAFAECSHHLEQEVQLLRPRLVISLSQRVLQLLAVRYLGLVLPMKAIFGSLLYLPVRGVAIPWIPVVHLPKPGPKVRKHYFPAQTERLGDLRASVQSLVRRQPG